jgi:hypothetical protein
MKLKLNIKSILFHINKIKILIYIIIIFEIFYINKFNYNTSYNKNFHNINNNRNNKRKYISLNFFLIFLKVHFVLKLKNAFEYIF